MLNETIAKPSDTPDNSGTDGYETGDIVTIRPRQEVISRQGLPNFVGISAGTAGARGLCGCSIARSRRTTTRARPNAS